MGEVKVLINGFEVKGSAKSTILEAAEQIGVRIPTLCHKPELKAGGGCRVCVVEVQGLPRLVAACHTPLEKGMVIHTHSPRVAAARKAVVELMLTAHTGSCVTDERAGSCELHKLAADLEVGPPRFKVRQPRSYPIEDISPYVRRDLSKCILCRRCIRACAEIAKKNIYDMAYRGFQSKVVVDYDVPLNKEACKDCGICIDYCPTSALMPGRGVA